MKHLNLTLSLAAGLAGGVLANYFAPALVHAQAPTPPPAEIRAQSFVLVNGLNQVMGTFSAEPDSSARAVIRKMPDGTTLMTPMGAKIKLTDPSGRVIWSAGGSGVIPLVASR